MSSDDLEALADRIAAVADDLDDVMFDRLREAAAAKGGRPTDDKRLLQARRALSKAEQILRGRPADD